MDLFLIEYMYIRYRNIRKYEEVLLILNFNLDILK